MFKKVGGLGLLHSTVCKAWQLIQQRKLVWVKVSACSSGVAERKLVMVKYDHYVKSFTQPPSLWMQ